MPPFHPELPPGKCHGGRRFRFAFDSFFTTRLFRSFDFGPLNFLFILLPVGILGVKSLLSLLASSGTEAEENADTAKYLASFFRPLLKIVRDWFPFFLLTACYYSLYDSLALRINPHMADGFLSGIDHLILGSQAAFLLEPWIRPWLTDFLNAVYFSHLIFFSRGRALFLSGPKTAGVPAFDDGLSHHHVDGNHQLSGAAGRWSRDLF
jgi:hypothetical protein